MVALWILSSRNNIGIRIKISISISIRVRATPKDYVGMRIIV